jgi:hypothetical protein
MSNTTVTDTPNPMYASAPMPNTSYYPITYQSINLPPVYTNSIEEGPVEEGTKGIRVRNGVEIYRKNGDIYEKIGTSPIARTFHFVIINGVKMIWKKFIELDLYVNKPMTMPSAGGKRKTRRNRKSKKSRKGKSRKNRRKSNRRRR